MKDVNINYKEQYNESLDDIYRPNNNKNAKDDGEHCLSCYANVKRTDKFCTSCGNKIIRCSKCFCVIPDDADFCPYCGDVTEKSNTELKEYIDKYGKEEGIWMYRFNLGFKNSRVHFHPFIALEVCTACGSTLGYVGNNKYNFCPHCGINLNHKNSRSVI